MFVWTVSEDRAASWGGLAVEGMRAGWLTQAVPHHRKVPPPDPLPGGGPPAPSLTQTATLSLCTSVSLPVQERWKLGHGTEAPALTPSLQPPTSATVSRHLSACQSNIQQFQCGERAGQAGGGCAGRWGGGRLLHQAGLGRLRFVPTHGAVEADVLNSPDSSRESVAPPSATRGLPGPHYQPGN